MPKENRTKSDLSGAQRLSLDALRQWESLRFGGMIHYGISTYTGWALEQFRPAPCVYAPTRLDVDQWVDVMAEAGMRYAVLTAKHNSGFCLWPSKLTEYHVGHGGGDTRDVMALFAEACRKRGILPGVYYNWRDNGWFHGKVEDAGIDRQLDEGFSAGRLGPHHITEEYIEYMLGQLAELLANYGPWCEIWIDSPGLGQDLDGAKKVYDLAARLQPDAIIQMNNGFSDGKKISPWCWPTDVINGEDTLPPEEGHNPWRTIAGEEYYIPMEVQYRVTPEWFHVYNFNQTLRPAEELENIYRKTMERNANLLFNIVPDRRGLIPKQQAAHLFEVLKKARNT